VKKQVSLRGPHDHGHHTAETGRRVFRRLHLLEDLVIILGIVLLVLGLLLKISILWTIGIILVVIGAILAVLGGTGRAIGGRKHWY
jgi:hypothetical protein